MGKTIATIYCSLTCYNASVLHDCRQPIHPVRGRHCYLGAAFEKHRHINNLAKVTQLGRGKQHLNPGLPEPTSLCYHMQNHEIIL